MTFRVKLKTRCGAERIIDGYEKPPNLVHGPELSIRLKTNVPDFLSSEISSPIYRIFQYIRVEDGNTYIYEEK